VVDGLVVLVAVAMAVGIVGTVVPVVPGLALVWAAGLVYGISAGFGAVGVVAFAVMTLLAAAGIVAGWLVPQRAAGRAGATRLSMAVAAVCAVIGFFVVPVVGLPLGGLAGLYLAELQRTSDAATAWRTTRSTLVAFGLASLVQLAAGVAMALVWVAWVIAA
jgi:hypothetical protein